MTTRIRPEHAITLAAASLGICLAVPRVVALPQAPGSPQTTETDRTDKPQTSDGLKAPQYRVTMLGEGFSKTGVHTALTGIIDDSNGAKIQRVNFYMSSPAAAKEVFQGELAVATDSGGKSVPEKSLSANEERAVVTLPFKRDCDKGTEILYTDGAMLHEIYSCSSGAAHQYEQYLRGHTASTSQNQPAGDQARTSTPADSPGNSAPQ